jgi:hypothetical protein
MISLLLLSTHVWAATPDLLQTFPAEVLRYEVVEFRPQKAHHFSLEAPQNCGGGEMVAREARALKCQFTQPGKASATFNVCDDKKTFCKPVSLALNVLERAAPDSKRLRANETLNRELKHTLVPGFETGTPEALKKKAAQAGKPVFMMVSTDWCPPCNEAKEHLLSSQMFHELSAGWTKVYVDGDCLGAADWEKAVPYRYYPSFIFLNSSFQETGR